MLVGLEATNFAGRRLVSALPRLRQLLHNNTAFFVSHGGSAFPLAHAKMKVRFGLCSSCSVWGNVPSQAAHSMPRVRSAPQEKSEMGRR